MFITVYIDILLKLLEMVFGHSSKDIPCDFLVYAHCFMSIRISPMKDHSISVDQAIYPASIFVNTWIMPQLRQVQIFTRPLFHLI